MYASGLNPLTQRLVGAVDLERYEYSRDFVEERHLDSEKQTMRKHRRPFCHS